MGVQVHGLGANEPTSTPPLATPLHLAMSRVPFSTDLESVLHDLGVHRVNYAPGYVTI